MTFPFVELEGKKFYEIGCEKCKCGGKWKVFIDLFDFVAQCECGHVTRLHRHYVKEMRF